MKKDFGSAGGRKNRRGRGLRQEDLFKIYIAAGAVLLLVIGIVVGSLLAKGSKDEEEELDLAEVEESIPEEEEEVAVEATTEATEADEAASEASSE